MSVNDWRDMFPAEITYEEVDTRDDYGKPTYKAGVKYKARVVKKQKKVYDPGTGQEQIALTQVWIMGVLTSLSMDDQITLPDSSTPQIIAWDIPSDENGFHHTKVFFGAARR